MRCGNQFFFDLTVHVLVHQAKRLIKGVLRDVENSDVVTGKCDHMGNAIAHLTGANYANGFDIFQRSHLFPTRPLGSKQQYALL